MRALEVAWAWGSTCDLWLKSKSIAELVSFPLARLGPTYVTSIANNPRSLANNVAVIRPRKQHVVNYFLGVDVFQRSSPTRHDSLTRHAPNNFVTGKFWPAVGGGLALSVPELLG